MLHFVAARDELLFDSPVPAGRLVPYQIGQPCLHWEAAVISAENDREVLSVLTDQSEADRRDERPVQRPAHR